MSSCITNVKDNLYWASVKIDLPPLNLFFNIYIGEKKHANGIASSAVSFHWNLLEYVTMQNENGLKCEYAYKSNMWLIIC